ncbi:MAG: patatin-like phospholipase family protein [Deltaproteobacteria bacterium]|nr:patatin-like phospholipase family protein [Deltaproteobacteria bacterium]
MRTTLRLLLCVAALQLSFNSNANAEKKEKAGPYPRPRVALVLEGGGALGFAHVGVIKVLEEANIPVEFVTGTSMGSIVGAAFASGSTVENMEKILSSTDWDQLFNENPPRDMVNYREKSGRGRELFGDAKLGFQDGGFIVPSALVQGQYVELLLQGLFNKAPPSIAFDKLPVPYRAVAADIETGEEVILDHGSLAIAARASMSVPGFFAPVELDGRLLVDGGIVNNFPVDIALARNPQYIIGVEFKSVFRKRDSLTNPLAISAQMMDLLLERTTASRIAMLRKQDIMIQPDLTNYSSTSFNKAREIMMAGEVAARAALPKLRHLAVPHDEFERYYKLRTGHQPFAPKLEFVEVHDTSPQGKTAILAAVSVKPGDVYDHDKISEELTPLYQNGQFKKVTQQVVEENGKYGLLLEGEEKEWLNKYVRLGLSLQDNFTGDSGYSLAADVRFNNLGTYGSYADVQGEVGTSPRFFTEFYQPLGTGSPFFVAPSIDLSRKDIKVLDGSDIVAEYHRQQMVLGTDLGYTFGKYGELTSGWRRGPGKLNRYIGASAVPSFDFEIGEIVSSLTIDQMDNVDFPTEGYRFGVTSKQSRDSLGASSDFQQNGAQMAAPFTVGANTLMFSGSLGTSSDNLPVERSYSIGGPFDISGYQLGSLTADYYWVGRALLTHRIAEGSSALFKLGGYLGGTVEVANVQTNIESIPDPGSILAGSVFIGADTPLVPVYLGFGMSDQQERSIFLNIGRIAARSR